MQEENLTPVLSSSQLAVVFLATTTLTALWTQISTLEIWGHSVFVWVSYSDDFCHLGLFSPSRLIRVASFHYLDPHAANATSIAR
jgi:hypothetical protein